MGKDIESGITDIWRLSACEVVDLLRRREMSPAEVLDSLGRRIAQVNPVVNALPTICFDRALKRATHIGDQELDGGLLSRLPIVIKDSIPVKGVRTTYGSLVFKDNVPDHSDAVVRRIEASGGLVYAKSNTPEFEAGANTFNEVFGVTRNPWNTSLSAGGSSGGAAVSVATGMAWLAQGTDFACSLRNPASFNGVVGLRPSLGVVPQGPNNAPFQSLSVSGPIARSVADCGLFLEAMAGFDVADPFSSCGNGIGYASAAQNPIRPIKIGFSQDLGLVPVDPVVRSVITNAAETLSGTGVEVVQAHPDMSGAHEAFRTLRALQFAVTWGHLLPDHQDLLKPDVVWNIEEGLNLDATQIVRAETLRRRLRQNLLTFFETHDALITPVSIVPPYSLEQRYVASCDGVEFDNYLEWMAIAYAISLTGCPAISVPCGFTPDGLPIGLQIVTAPSSDAKLLGIAAFAEVVFGASLRSPIDPNVTDTSKTGEGG